MEEEFSRGLNLGSPLSKGSIRPQRSLNCSPLTQKSSDVSLIHSFNVGCGYKTPRKNTPVDRRALSKTPKRSSGKSCRNRTPRTPTFSGDRFIPYRSSSQIELGHHLLNSVHQADQVDQDSPSKREYEKALQSQLPSGGSEGKIMLYQNKAKTPTSDKKKTSTLFSQALSSCSRKIFRNIPQVPERILDAPDLIDDYYLNLLDWSAQNQLAVALRGSVYLWNAGSGEIQQLFELDGADDYVCSLSWIKEGNIISIGTSSGDIMLWDVDEQKCLRKMSGHVARVACMSWNNYVVSSGDRAGNIHHHDVRVANHLVGSVLGHTQEVCGLKWSLDGRYLASGGNDNLLKIWPVATSSCHAETTPLHVLNSHTAAVKALAWCPWQSNILASGGGTADGHIRLWNINNSTCLKSVDTKSQVCSLLWSNEHKELISGHGLTQNQLVIWKYPTMNKVTELLGHTSRVLHMAMSPDHSTVVSAAADETLRLWKCFEIEKKKLEKQESLASGMLRQNIR